MFGSRKRKEKKEERKEARKAEKREKKMEKGVVYWRNIPIDNKRISDCGEWGD